MAVMSPGPFREHRTTDLYRKRPGRKNLDEVVMVEPGRFGSSRKKEAAARRFGISPLWVFEGCPASREPDCPDVDAQEKFLERGCDLRRSQRRVGPGFEAACQGAEVAVWIRQQLSGFRTAISIIHPKRGKPHDANRTFHTCSDRNAKERDEVGHRDV